MSNRSFSFLKRFKTEKTERNHLIGWRAANKTPTSRAQNTSRSPAHKEIFEKVELKQRDNYLVKCVNHPLKKALFQPKQSLKEAYCQDCSIKMVKHNVRMVRLTEESLYLRTMYEAEVEKIFNYEQEARQIVARYFETQRQIVKLSYLKTKEVSQKVFHIPSFKMQNLNEVDFTLKLKQLMGSVHFKKIEFVHSPDSEELKRHCYQKIQAKEVELESYYESITNKQNHNGENVQGKWNPDGKLKRMPSKDGQKSACLR